MFKKLLIILFILFSLLFFYKVNDINYEKHNEIKKMIINHPENLPKKDFAKASSFWFNNLKADYYWLKTVQYIWANAFHSEYKKYLFEIIDLVTELNPFFESPYITWMLLLPAYEARYEFITAEENQVYIESAAKLWLKAMNNFCNMEKVNLIKENENLVEVWDEEKYKNPCRSYIMPFYLAYIYFFYKNEPLEASHYYRIASANDDAPEWAKVLAAIMAWKWWNREKSYFMFLTMAMADKEENELCSILSNELYNLGLWVFNQELDLSSKLIKNINDLRDENLLTEDDIEWNDPLKENECTNNINKAIRELNLEFIERAYKKYQEENTEKIYTAKDLLDKWYIDYLPTDHQKYDEYWIIYIINKETWNFDYMLGNY